MQCKIIAHHQSRSMLKSYHELIQIKDYHSRLEYLKLLDNNANSPRSISLEFYNSLLWHTIRTEVIKRDGRFDLGIFGMCIDGAVYVHHINPINETDIINMSFKLTDVNNLVCVSLATHNAIHYKTKLDTYVERKPGDTKLW